jgi:phosphoribosylformimino-5-aminoimidazole carboxamide ribotide isomerase
MTIIGVVDLLHGRAVHAVAGDRTHYQPIDDGSAVALATTYVSHPQVSALYIADLDAIEQRASNDATVRALVALGHPVWLDAGVTTVTQAAHALSLGVSRVVIGLETLTSFDALREICEATGGHRVAFSLDLRDGEPIIASPLVEPGTPERLAARAIAAGAGAIIVLDLARVGTSTGIDVGLIARVRAVIDSVELVAGGGVRSLDDLEQLRRSGADRTLMATALRGSARRALQRQSING